MDVARRAWSVVMYVASSQVSREAECWEQDGVLPWASPRASGQCFLGTFWIPDPLAFSVQQRLGLVPGRALRSSEDGC